jgi:hypothetical protein
MLDGVNGPSVFSLELFASCKMRSSPKIILMKWTSKYITGAMVLRVAEVSQNQCKRASITPLNSLMPDHAASPFYGTKMEHRERNSIAPWPSAR